MEGAPTHIVELVPDEKLVLAWPDWRGDKAVNGQTIAFHPERAGSGTMLTFVHAGFGRTTNMRDYEFGWTTLLGNLVAVIRTPGATRALVIPASD